MKEHLASFGFLNVYNENIDFYASPLKEYDVLVTNPPFSDPHLENILKFCHASGKPSLLLMPNFVYIKDYFPFNTHFAFPKDEKRYSFHVPR